MKFTSGKLLLNKLKKLKPFLCVSGWPEDLGGSHSELRIWNHFHGKSFIDDQGFKVRTMRSEKFKESKNSNLSSRRLSTPTLNSLTKRYLSFFQLPWNFQVELSSWKLLRRRRSSSCTGDASESRGKILLGGKFCAWIRKASYFERGTHFKMHSRPGFLGCNFLLANKY